VQVDATKLADAMPYMHQVWSAPLQCCHHICDHLPNMAGVVGAAAVL
jgi:hypothetical protein